MLPLFTVVIPTFNRKKFLKRSTDSVLNQTYKDFELIIVDDGSTDATIELMADYTGKGINYIRTPNLGVSHGRNTGIKNSRGSYIAFLDSDDYWESTKLEHVIYEINKSPDINIFHTEEIWYKNGKLLGQKKKHKKPDGYVYENCLPLCCIGMSTSVVKRTLFDEIGMFDEKLPACEDYDLWLRACLRNEVKLIKEPLTIKDGGRDDQLSNQAGLDKYRIYALEKMINSGKLSGEKLELTISELEKKCTIFANGSEKRGKLEEAKKYREKITEYRQRN